MKITYISHSAFLVETRQNLLLFDYAEGTLPPLPQKPLFIFASHNHGDHFHKKIYELPALHYFLSQDIKYKGFPGELAPKITFMRKNQHCDSEGIGVSTLRSTDQGVAFVVETEDIALYHAGDLNHWYWEEETDAWNRQMGEKYQAEMKKLRGQHFAAAFIPLDGRLGAAFDWGIEGFLAEASADAIFPMHMWGNYAVIQQYRHKHAAQTLMEINRNGQEFIISQ